MSKKKKVTLIVVTIIAFIVAIILGFTYSKYVSSANVSATASSAVWSFDGAISKDGNTKEKSISLNQTITEDLAGSGKLAPGTKGEFNIIVDATGSEVDVDYDVLLNNTEDGQPEESKPNNLYFTCADLEAEGTAETDYKKYYSLEEMLATNADGTSKLNGTVAKNSQEVITIKWVWPYESTRTDLPKSDLDALDTEDSGITDYSFKLNIVGRQAQ